MKLGELIAGLELTEIVDADESLEISGISGDSRLVEPGYLFVALKGTHTDGHRFIPEALHRGAAAILYEKPVEIPPGVCRLRAPSTRPLYPLLAARFYGLPGEKLRLIGVTGTNGKTSTTLLVAAILRAMNQRPAVVGTLGFGMPPSDMQSEYQFAERGLTTPDSVKLQSLLAQALAAGATHAVMEVSSHALVQSRVDYIHFRGRVFTNLSPEHLDYHRTMEEYAAAKRSFFSRPQLGSIEYAVVNGEDKLGKEIAEQLACPTLTFGSELTSALTGTIQHASLEGATYQLEYRAAKVHHRSPLVPADDLLLTVSSPLIGQHNLANMLASVGCGLMEGADAAALKSGLESVRNIPGRLERVANPRGLHIFVDYAHTPDALRQTLSTLRALAGTKRIITVFGCGGDRDQLKRPLMGKVVAEASDAIVVTSDNPRSENPEAITDDILKGIRTARPVRNPKYIVELNRRRAIALAISEADAGDSVLIAGKGHEDYQIFHDRKVPFNDASVAAELASSRA